MFSRAMLRSLMPAEEVPTDGTYEDPYPLLKLKAPVVTGTALRIMVAIAESPLGGPVRTQLLRNNQVLQMLEDVFVPERPTYLPNCVGWRHESSSGLVPVTDAASGQAAAGSASAICAMAAAAAPGILQQPSEAAPGALSSGSRRHHTAAAFHAAYAASTVTPSQVAENVIAAVAASEAQSPPMKFLVAHDPSRQQAAASTQRWKEGRPLSPLDGVPFAVKDGCDALPYPTTSGTAFMAEWRTPTHSLAGVQVLLDAGAVLIGKANLHEIGLGTTGLNIRTGTPRNPHSTAHHTGGSSSGSAALVAAGICPFALGSDGGGSIRIPAALCGIVGLKMTHERVGTVVGTPPIDQTVAVLGPLAASVQDCALMYAGLANSGQRTGETPPAPVMLPAPLGADGGTPLAGKTAGIDWKWFEDAEPAVLEACRAAVALLQERGLSLVPVHLPEKALLRAAHTCTIVSEMRNNMTAALQHGPTRRRFNCETRVSLAVAGSFEAAHYLQAQKIRTRAEAFYRRAFERCDFIITPTLPCTAPPIKPAALSCGETDLGTTTSLMWYMQAANMLGLPAISVPIGAVPSTHSHTPAAAGSDGPAPPLLLPAALQLMAPCWHEASLLRVGAVLEAAVAEAGKALPLPPVWFDVLKEAAADGVPE